MIIPVILSGGSGSRLWPVSREHYPKQFLNLHNEKLSLLQEAALRLSDVDIDVQAPLIICNEEHRFLVAEQMQQVGINKVGIILEPCGRNTAPALALAALAAVADGRANAQLLVMPADHVIKDTYAFSQAIVHGSKLADSGKLVTFGIEPGVAHTGYGYIKRGQPLAAGFIVDSFVEKPDLTKAQEYLATGQYLWNSGIFLVEAKVYLEALATYANDILEECQTAFANRNEDLDFIRVDVEAFSRCRSESIDYAVMEHTDQATVVPMSPGWSDIGAWDALHELAAGSSIDGNALRGDVLLHDTHNSLVHSESRLVATVGVENLVVIETEDAVLVASREHAQATKQIVNALKAGGRKEYQSHRQVYRPWGHYRTLVLTDGFQVKEIMVKPGCKLSLQMHHHRAEHWVVVNGTAQVTLGDGYANTDNLRSFILAEDQSTYIPLGTIHRLENPGAIPLKLIEVQTGAYLGEDDIVRYSDDYGRQ